MESLDPSPHGDSLSGSRCRWRGPPQGVDEAPELERHIHFCRGAEDDGGAAEDGHLAVERRGGGQMKQGEHEQHKMYISDVQQGSCGRTGGGREGKLRKA